MTKLPIISGSKVIKALGKAGFEVVRIKGSHHRLAHSDGRKTTVPVHRGETISIGLLAKILRDCDLSKDDFQELI